MAEKTIVDYETVEKKKTVTVCDECDKKEEESQTILPVGINPCSEYGDNTILSEQKDMCVSCATKIFDINIPEDVEVIEAKTNNSGSVNIKTKKEVTTIWPNSNIVYSKVWFLFGTFIAPLVLILSTYDNTTEWKDDVSKDQTWFVGLASGILWTLLSFRLYYFLF